MPTFELSMPQTLSLHVFVKYLTTDLTGGKLLSPSFFMGFQLFEAIGEDSSPLCTESMTPVRSQGCATLPQSAGPGHIWAIFLTHPKASCSIWTRRTSLAKLTTFSYEELWESTLEKIPNKISFSRRLERQEEVMALRQLSNPMTARESPSQILALH